MTKLSDIETMYAQYEGLIVKQAMGHQGLYADVLGPDDAVQEAGLAFVEAYRQYERYGEAVLGNEKALAGYFKTFIQYHLTTAVRKELAYQNHQPLNLDQCLDDTIPDPELDVEELILYREDMDRDEFRLRILRYLLSHPQLLVDKAGLKVPESLVIWKLYVDGLSVRVAAGRLNLYNTQLCRIQDMALYKLKQFILDYEKKSA